MRGSRQIVVLLVSILILLSVATAAGCAQKSYTLRAGKLTVGTMSDAEPFEFEKSGKMTGFDMELAAALAKRMGLELELVTDPWDSLVSNLNAGKYDVVMAATTITFDRQQRLDFSNPYFKTDQAISVMKGSPIRSGNDLVGRTVGVLNNSTPQYAAEKIPGLKAINKYDTVPKVFDALESGQVDAMIMDHSIAEYHARKAGNQQVIADIKTDEEYGIVMKKGSTGLAAKVNSALGKVRQDGTYQKLLDKWFGSSYHAGG